jgi:hypothetical protein
MRARLPPLLLLFVFSSAFAGSNVTVYDPDPNHLWNRLYQALAVRTLGGVQYGVDNADAYPDPFDNSARAGKLLDEFLSKHGESLSANATARALLLNDVWTAFDMSVRDVWGSPALTTRLARVLSKLRLTPSEISALPDNYELAVKSEKFASDFNPAHPETPFLPPDLFDPNGPWVQIANREHGPTAQMHAEIYSGRSLFLVFIRCPGGREATLAYLQRLNSYPTPLIPAASMPGLISFSRDRHSVPLSYDPKTPEFPEGTVVALVRRLMVIDQNLNPTFAPITQRVQLRVYRKLDSQSVYEFVMRRQSLTTAPDSSLHAISPDEREYQTTIVPIERGNAAYFEGPVVLRTCATCHSGTGVLSLNTYRGFFNDAQTNPQLLPVDVNTGQSALTIRWKQTRFDWGMLQGIWAADQAH